MKRTIIQRVSNSTGMPKHVVTDIFDAVIKEIKDAIISGEKVTFQEFGTFSLKVRKSFTVKHPQTKEEITIPERKTPSFSASKTFKDICKR